MLKAVDNFFYPKNICVAGASSKEKSIGYELLRSIKNYGFKGKIFPVNPKSEEILGYKCFKTINDINEPIDLALVVVPKFTVEDTIGKLLNKDVKSIILVTAGFKEVGKQGAEDEKRLLELIREKGARLIGPNCMGVISTFDDIKLNATFVAEKPEKGQTAFLSQSGAIGAAVLNSLRETDIRFGHFVSVGNKADISENDLLPFWEKDERIKIVTLYLESFSSGEKLLNMFINREITKPVVILKAGRSNAGMKAALSHTGALGSSEKVVEAVLNQFGIIRVDDLNELFNTSKGFENFNMPKGKRIAVVTNAGGPAILTVDSIEKENLILAEISECTKEKLRKIAPPQGSVNNPVDLLPGGTKEQYRKVNEILCDDENVDAVISVFVEPVMVPAFPVIEEINGIKSYKPIFQVVMPLPEFWEEYRTNSKYKIPLFRNPEDPAKVIANMLFYSNRRNNSVNKPKGKVEKNPYNDGFLDLDDVKELAAKYNLPLSESKLIEKNEIIKISEEIKYPVVLKGISGKAIHKTEFKGVVLNINSKLELISAANEIEKNFKIKNVEVEKYLIQPFIKAEHELLIGGFRDPAFGPMLMFGSGGKYVEVYNDTCLKSAYLSKADISDMINKTKIGEILKGVRGTMDIDLNKLYSLINSASLLMLENPFIEEFDFNPVLIDKEGNVSLVDVRIKTAIK